jgi:hypothetical protein
MPMTDALYVQVGRESSWGTPAVDTARLMGISDFTINPEVNVRVIGLSRGGYAPGSSAVITDISAAASLSQEATYEDLHVWLEGLRGNVSPTGTGPYVRLYAAPTSTAPTLIAHSIYVGDGVLAPYRIFGALPSGLTLSGSVGEVVTVSGDWMGKGVDVAANLASLTDRAVNPLMFHHLTGVFVDTWAGTIGTTALTNSLYGFELAITTERPTRRYAGQTTAGAYNQRKWSGTLRLDIDFNTTTKALLDAIVGASAPVMRQIRLSFTDGTRILQIDFAGTVTEAPSIFEDDDDVAVIPLTFTGTYNSTLGNWLKLTTTTGITAANVTNGTYV